MFCEYWMTRKQGKLSANRKIMNRFIVLVIVAFIIFGAILPPVKGQDRERYGNLHGVVLDAVTRQPIPAANILIVGSHLGAAADLDGRFAIVNLPAGSYHLRASALGYTTRELQEIVVLPGRDGFAEFLLHPAAIVGEEVTVTAERVQVASPNLPTSTRNLRYEEVRRAPGAIEDIQRMVQAMPGVMNSDDQDNEIIVRGGSPLENLTIIDGIEVNNTNHLTIGSEGMGNGGPINALNTEFLQEVTFASGGFAPRYGDRMSSVLELNLREGNRERFGGELDLSMSGVGGHMEGPIDNGRGSFLASVHKSYLDLLPPEDFGVDAWPSYWNSQAKVAYDLSDRHLLTINGLYLEDYISEYPNTDVPEDHEDYDEEGMVFNTERHYFGARLRSLWGNGFTDLVVARTYAYVHWDYFEERLANDQTRIFHTYTNRRTDIEDQFHLHYTGRAFGQDQWGAGISVKNVSYRLEQYVEGDSIIFNDDYFGPDDGLDPDTFFYSDIHEDLDESSLKYGAYLQYTWHPVDRLSMTGGLRYDGFEYSGENAFGPRISVNWEFSNHWTASAAWGIYYQSQDVSIYMNEAGREYNRQLPYSRADQYVLGLRYQPRTSTLFSLEGYYKDYSDLLVSEEDVIRETIGDETFESDRWLTSGEKEAWGIEFFAQQKLFANWYGILSYSYGNTETTDPAYGTYPSSYDFRHVITGVLGYKTSLVTNDSYRRFLHRPWGWWLWALPINGDQVTLSTRYRYMTGRPYTRETWYEDGESSPLPIYEGHWESEGHNNERYRDYNRLDFRIDSKHYFGSSALIVFLEVQNLLDRINISDYTYEDDGERDATDQFRQFYVLGIKYQF